MKNGTDVFRTTALGRHLYNLMMLQKEARNMLCDIKLDITSSAINLDRRLIHREKLEAFNQQVQHHLFEQMILEEKYQIHSNFLRMADTSISEVRMILREAQHRLY